jgi:hypothetical protein
MTEPNRRAGAAGADRQSPRDLVGGGRRPRVWPSQWQCRWLRDGRVAFLELNDDRRWHIIVGPSTVAVVATKAQAFRVVDGLSGLKGEHAAPRAARKALDLAAGEGKS